jgi:glycosyltransferase involved in cell wall biosynthesis
MTNLKDSKNIQTKPKVALMSYAMDNRSAKGTALYTRKLIEGLLSDDRFEFYLVHYDKVEDPLYDNANEIIMPKVSLPYGSRFISQMLFFWKYRNRGFDIVHWFQPRVYPFYWLAPAKKIIVTMHGAGDISAPTNFVFSRVVFNFVLKNLHKWIDKIIVVSGNAKEEVVDYYGFKENEVEVTYNGGGEDFKPIDKAFAKDLVYKKYGINGQYIFDLSRLIPHKNVASLIKAYDLLRSKHKEITHKLVIVGGKVNGGVIETKLAKNSVFSKDIIFINFIESSDLNAFYSASDVFVFPSLSEGFGLPAVEAMASGVPVITSNVTSMPEIGGQAVITVDPLDIDNMAKEMHNVLVNKELREKMIFLGLERAKEFTWGKMVEKTKDLYIEILK